MQVVWSKSMDQRSPKEFVRSDDQEFNAVDDTIGEIGLIEDDKSKLEGSGGNRKYSLMNWKKKNQAEPELLFGDFGY